MTATADRPVLAGDDRGLFASDIHLTRQAADTAEQFFSALARHAPDATDVFLLGDLFDYWVGDDQDDALAARLADTLRGLASGGRRVWLMRGNRDFLLDTGRPAFSERAGARLLPDPTVAQCFGQPVLLAHGDALCIDDVDYQRMRVQVRDPHWQQRFLAQPLAARLAYAHGLRARSEQEKRIKDESLMDVNPAQVLRLMREHDVTLLVHGHTHRPAHHRMDDDGTQRERRVLPDWDAALGRGGFLRVDRSGWHVVAP